ncbi:hypothetical protein RB213_008809 [Colletotrichum asianum]
MLFKSNYRCAQAKAALPAWLAASLRTSRLRSVNFCTRYPFEETNKWPDNWVEFAATLENEVETYDSICYEIGNDELKPNAPWGFAVYRTCYSDESSWRRMRQHIETCIQDTVTFIEDKQSLDTAGPVQVKVHFDTWARQELARNWKERSETPEVGLFPYGGPPSPKQMMFYGARYNVCMVIDDVCLQSVDETRKHTGPVALLLKREWQPIRFREGDDVHPDYEDGWMIDHDEGPNGWIYVRASNYVQHYNDLNEWYNDWDEDHMFMYPSVVYEELGLKRSPGFWRQKTNAHENK